MKFQVYHCFWLPFSLGALSSELISWSELRGSVAGLFFSTDMRVHKGTYVIFLSFKKKEVDRCRHQQDIISPKNWRQFDSVMRRGRKFTNISERAMLSRWRKWGMSCCYCAYSTGIPKGQNKPILRPQSGKEQVDSYFISVVFVTSLLLFQLWCCL